MKFTLGAAILVILYAGCGWQVSRANKANDSRRLTDDDKHRLYAAALAASDSPLDSEIFLRVCQRIEVFDADGRPNDKYIQFVSAHVDWAIHRQTESFRNEINTREKARQYVNQRLTG